jgi:hypothetical protein
LKRKLVGDLRKKFTNCMKLEGARGSGSPGFSSRFQGGMPVLAPFNCPLGHRCPFELFSDLERLPIVVSFVEIRVVDPMLVVYR